MVAIQLPTSGLLVTKCRDLAADELPSTLECMLGAMIYSELHEQISGVVHDITGLLVLRFRSFGSGQLYGLDWEFTVKPSEAACDPVTCDGRFTLDTVAHSGPYLSGKIVTDIKQRLAEIFSETHKRAEIVAQTWAGMLGNGLA